MDDYYSSSIELSTGSPHPTHHTATHLSLLVSTTCL
ncbi:hypothetical protein DFA_03798 [Cavenderia fasciculata]|uniref:Uncharacterized protein n=1 Tax=Cavenderia fasciculata TaxID=261658 RepID=F4Q0F3_CACFS|nr:uncharacterized protein DFA_03798 [Cavenderia fasciculata]EGG18304.1 hypothetical protein DFA_03798 [Cavenderia fasciculata]|eukprot:XP_004357127.1 hypothetical protein DFA_03798 [Cavenderia fasciculata]